MICWELCEDVVWPEGEGHSVEDGGNEWFGVGGLRFGNEVGHRNSWFI